MVRIPDASEFNPRQDFGVDRDVQLNPRIASISNAGAPGQALAAAGKEAGSAFMEAAQKAQVEQQQLNAFNATTGFYNTTGAVNRELDERMKSAPADGSGVDTMFGEVFDKNFGSYLAGITDPKLRARKEADVAQARTQYEARGRSAMEGLRSNHYTGEINRFGTSAVNGLQQNPEAWDATNAGLGQLIAQSGLPPEAKSRIIEQWEPKLIQGRLEGYRRLADQAEREGRLDDAKALRAKASDFATDMDRQQAARAGITPAAPGSIGAPPTVPGARWQGPTPAVTAATRAVLSKQRSAAVNELNNDPQLKAFVFGVAKGEDDENPGYVLESLLNRAAMTGKSVRELVNSGFYGPVNRGEIKAEPQGTKFYQKAQEAFEDAAAGSNHIELRTDQGMANEHRFADANPGVGGKKRFGADWYSHMGSDGVNYARKTQAEIEALAGGTGTYATYNTALGQQSEARLKQEQVQARAEQARQENDYVNQVQFAIHDGKYGIADLQRDREAGRITDADKYLRLEKWINDQNDDVNVLADAFDKIQGGRKDYVFDPMDKDDKKAVELYSSALSVGKNLGKQDTQAVAQAAAIMDRTGMIPKDVQGPLQGLYKSQDVSAFNFGMQAMRSLYERNPEVFSKTFGEKVARDVGAFTVTSGYSSPEQSFKLLKKDADPAVETHKEKLRQSADKLLKDGGITAASIPDIFYSNLDKTGAASRDLGTPDRDGWEGGPPLSTAQSGLLSEDYRRLFRENYALVNGDEDAAKKLTVQQMQRVWGETGVHGPGGGSIWGFLGPRDRIMRNPPERYYQPVNGSYDWMRKEVEGHVKTALPGATDWEMVALPETLADIKAGTAPRYGVQVRDQNGAWVDLRGPDNRPVAIRFDQKGLGPPQPGVAAKAAEAARARVANHDANAGVSVAGGNPFALTEQEKAPAGPEMNEAVRRRRGAAGAPIVPE